MSTTGCCSFGIDFFLLMDDLESVDIAGSCVASGVCALVTSFRAEFSLSGLFALLFDVESG